MLVKIGIDPEFFVHKKNGDIISAHGMIPGTKAKPFKVKYGAVQVDGMAVEINIIPTSKVDVFVRNTTEVMEQLKDMLPTGHSLSKSHAYTFSSQYMHTVPEEAKELGCDPDMNAYTMQFNPTLDGSETNLRSASGHIHIGWRTADDSIVDDSLHIAECAMVAKELDVALGAPSILYENNTLGRLRRSQYGKAGAFRPKPYGVEYRVLSNWWLKDEQSIRWVFLTAKRVMHNIISGAKVRSLFNNGTYCNQFANVINNPATSKADIKYYLKDMINYNAGCANYATL